MNLKKHISKGLIIISLLFANSCVEPFEYESENFEKLIIINAVITDEIKQQEVNITNTTPIDEHYISAETNAQVIVKDDLGNQYSFSEVEPGNYVSLNTFGAEEGRNYSLQVETSNGRKYYSQEVNLISGKQPIDVNPIRRVNDDGIIGVDILVNSYDETNNSKYYRYEYEETYKIIAPNWSPYDLVSSGRGCGSPFELVLRELEQPTCYQTIISNRIIQGNTINLAEDRVVDFSVRFIPLTNTIIRDRYSISVKQYVQSRNAYAYYEKINKSIEEGNVFSQVQTGFVQGNIFSETSSDENVIGFFEVSSVVSKRVFFNFEDIFPNEDKPEFDCIIISPPIQEEDACPLLERLETSYMYFQDNLVPTEFEGPYTVVSGNCADCTKLGTLEIPSFWIE